MLMNGNYGIPRDIYYVVKIAAVSVVKLGLVIAATLIAFSISTSLFVNNLWLLLLFPINSAAIAIYLLLPTNGGKSNWQSFYLSLKRHKKFWISLS